MKDLTPVRVPVIGYPDEVAMVLRTQQKLGRLVGDPALFPQSPLITDPRKVIVQAELLVAQDRPKRRADNAFAEIGKALAFVLILFVLAGVLIYATFAALGPKLILGILAIGALTMIVMGLLFRSKPAGNCPGVTTHCPPQHHR